MQCPIHRQLNEVVCEKCRTFLCPVCIASHPCGHPQKFTHILKFCERDVKPRFAALLERLEKNKATLYDPLVKLHSDLKDKILLIKNVITQYQKYKDTLQTLANEMKGYSSSRANHENKTLFYRNLNINKKFLLDAIKQEDIPKMITQIKIILLLNNKSIEEKTPELISTIKSNIQDLLNNTLICRLINLIQQALSKAIHTKSTAYMNNWGYNALDKGIKITKNESQTLLKKTSIKKKEIVLGDPIFPNTLFAYEMYFEGMNNTRDFFGIIEKSKFDQYYRSDKFELYIFDELIGFYRDKYLKNLFPVKFSYRGKEKYILKVDLIEGKMVLFGESIYFKADLHTDRIYLPIFIFASTGLTFKVRPLKTFDEAVPPECPECEGKDFCDNTCSIEKKYRGSELTLMVYPGEICTRHFTEKTYQQRIGFRCKTCFVERNTCICLPCSRICHRDHALSEGIEMGMFCDCGLPKCKIHCEIP